MKVYIVGLSCVGKSTSGKLLAELLGYNFFDLDIEIEKFYKMPIERLRNSCNSMHGFRLKNSIVLDSLLQKDENSVIAGTISGLMKPYLEVYKKNKKKNNLISICLTDSAENILKRLTFYNIDSKLQVKELNDKERKHYIKEIKSDWSYFKDSYARADLIIGIDDVAVLDIPILILKELQQKGFAINAANSTSNP